jgi:phosphoribosyl-dephospho-CoA transferase
MRPVGIDRPEVHDLLLVDPDDLLGDCTAQPSWVNQALASCPWVVVRRGPPPAGQIAIGVRGTDRNERWGGFLDKASVKGVVRPPELLATARSPARIRRTPAASALAQLMEEWRDDLTLAWGPTGSVGYEMATGCHVTTQFSDLDIAIYAPERISVRQARSLWNGVSRLQTKADIIVETPECGFSLSEYAWKWPAGILLRYPEGPRLGDDPWSRQ